MGLDGGGGLPPPGGGGGAGGGGAEATPRITFPLGGATVAPGMPLGVTGTTNRTDLAHVITIQDITPPPPSPAPIAFPGPNPMISPFGVTIPAANLAPGRQYEIVVTLAPAGAGNPHTDHSITITTSP